MIEKNIKLSVVIPTLNGSDYVNKLYEKLTVELAKLGYFYEIIFVDDGSTDGTIDILKRITHDGNLIKIIKFDKNYGQHSAIYAGIKKSCGDILILIHDDMENNVGDIGNFINKINSGIDVVCGRRFLKRNVLTLRRVISYFLNLYTSIAIGVRVHDLGCGLQAFRKEILNNASHLDVIKYLKQYKFCEIKIETYENIKKGRYNLLKLFKLLVTIFCFGKECFYAKSLRFYISESYNI